MKSVLQRVSKASVKIDDKIIAEIGTGLLVLLGIEVGDTVSEVRRLASKITRIRIFADDAGKMNLALPEIKGSALVVSQFTLCADTDRGNRPGFSNAAPPRVAETLYTYFCTQLVEEGIPVFKGRFGAHMQIELTNDGPVTIWLNAQPR